MTVGELIDVLVKKEFEVYLSYNDLPIRLYLETEKEWMDLGMGLNGVVRFKLSRTGCGLGSTVPSVLSIQFEELTTNLSVSLMESIRYELLNGLDVVVEYLNLVMSTQNP